MSGQPERLVCDDVCAWLTTPSHAPVDPVFFASQCGRASAHPPSATALAVQDARDYRVSSLNAAVEVCKANNLLGLLLDAEFLVRVLPFPSARAAAALTMTSTRSTRCRP